LRDAKGKDGHRNDDLDDKYGEKAIDFEAEGGKGPLICWIGRY
jgi:hypothetical protein